jgi:hypothetical protein
MKNFKNYHTSQSDKIIHDAQKLLSYQINYGFDSEDAIVNGRNIKVLMNDKTSSSETLKYITDEFNTLSNGDILELPNRQRWIITSYDTENKLTKKWVSKLCNIDLKWIDGLGEVESHPAVLSSNNSNINISEGNVMSLPDGNRRVLVQRNNSTLSLKRDKRFIIGKEAFKVTDVDYVSTDGIVHLTLNSSADLNPSRDNLELEIADYYGSIADYKIAINNGSFVTIADDQSLQLNVVVTNNNSPLFSPSLSYASSDELIAKVSLDGIITPITSGMAIITVTYKNVSAQIEVSITDSTAFSYTCEIIGSNEIKVGRTQSYTAKFYRNGIEYPDKSRFLLTSDDGVSPTKLASVSVQDEEMNTCSIVAGNSIGYVYLHVRNDNGLSESRIRIRIKPLY